MRQAKPHSRCCHAQVAGKRKLKSLVYGIAADERDGGLFDSGNCFTYAQAVEFVL